MSFKKTTRANGQNLRCFSSEYLSDGDQFGHKVEIVDNIIFVGSKNGDDDNRSRCRSSLCF